VIYRLVTNATEIVTGVQVLQNLIASSVESNKTLIHKIKRADLVAIALGCMKSMENVKLYAGMV
jgi:hypothetical protein